MLKHEQATKTRRMDRKPEINYRKKFKYYRQIIEPTWLSFNKYVKCNQKKKEEHSYPEEVVAGWADKNSS